MLRKGKGKKRDVVKQEIAAAAELVDEHTKEPQYPDETGLLNKNFKKLASRVGALEEKNTQLRNRVIELGEQAKEAKGFAEYAEYVDGEMETLRLRINQKLKTLEEMKDHRHQGAFGLHW